MVDFSLAELKDPKRCSRKMGPVTGRQLHMMPTVISTSLVGRSAVGMSGEIEGAKIEYPTMALIPAL